jgi:exonuclease VII small subunit
MKFSTLLILFLLLVQPAEAQTTTATTSENGGIFESVSEGVTTITETVQEQIKPTPSEVVLNARAQERITNLAANISNRFDAIIARLQNITSRLNTRIEKLDNAAVDTSAAKQSLEAAQTALDAARADMRGIDAKVLQVVGSTNPKADWQEVRATFISAREHVRTAHSELRSTVQHLKTAEAASTTSS